MYNSEKGKFARTLLEVLTNSARLQRSEID